MKLQQVKHIFLIGLLVIIVPTIILVLFRKRIFGFILKPEQEKHIAKLHRKAKFIFEKFIDRVEKETGYNIIITDSYRTFADQKIEHDLDPRNPEPGYSLHNFGMGLDLNATDGLSYLRKASSKEAWENTGIPQIAREMGIKWGGDFVYYHDPVHFDLSHDYDVNQLRELAISQYGTDWNNIFGNQIQLA